MKTVKFFALPLLATALVMTGCASRKPANTTGFTVSKNARRQSDIL